MPKGLNAHLGPFGRDSGLQTPKNIHPAGEAVAQRTAIACHLIKHRHWHEDFRRLAPDCAIEARCSYADHLKRMAIHRNSRANDSRIGCELVSPEIKAHDGDG